MTNQDSESSTLVNPLVSFREKLGLSPEELANEVSLAVVLIKVQEKGIPHHLHPRFLQAFPDTVELIPDYQRFREAKRRENFPRGTKTIPEVGPDFADWLRSTGLTPEEFSELACMPMVDIHYAMSHWRLPATITHFFQEINA